MNGAGRVGVAGTLLLVGSMIACARTPMLYPAPGIPVPSPPPAPLKEVVLEVDGVGSVSAWHLSLIHI